MCVFSASLIACSLTGLGWYPRHPEETFIHLNGVHFLATRCCFCVVFMWLSHISRLFGPESATDLIKICSRAEKHTSRVIFPSRIFLMSLRLPYVKVMIFTLNTNVKWIKDVMSLPPPLKWTVWNRLSRIYLCSSLWTERLPIWPLWCGELDEMIRARTDTWTSSWEDPLPKDLQINVVSASARNANHFEQKLKLHLFSDF